MNVPFIPRKIMKIDASESFRFAGQPGGYTDYEGFVITLDSGEQLAIGISNGQNCCESFGSVSSEDDLQSFVGATLLSYDIVDMDMAKQVNTVAAAEVYPVGEYNHDEGGAIFLNAETDRGALQFTVYNSHNGYYGHSVNVAFGNQFIHEDYL
jgi:hypothetical protein